jgi:hypothetical protein
VSDLETPGEPFEEGVLPAGPTPSSVVPLSRPRWPFRPFYPRRAWLLWLAFLALLVVGLVTSLLAPSLTCLSVPLGILAMLMLPTLALGSVGGVMRGISGTWRDVTSGLLGGATLGIGLATAAEGGLLAFALLLALLAGLIPGGLEGLRQLPEQFGDMETLLDPQVLSGLLTPTNLLVALLFISVATPLIEEAAKTLAVGLAGLYLRPSPPRAFLLGVASGAGFALVENLLNGSVAGPLWTAAALSRLAATFMHCATGGLMGWGWGQLWTTRRPWRLLLAYVGSFALHATWNGLVLGTVAGALYGIIHPEDLSRMMLAGLVILTLGTALLLLALAVIIGLLWAARALAARTARGALV